MDCIYCTPEWLEESARIYRATPRFARSFEKSDHAHLLSHHRRA